MKKLREKINSNHLDKYTLIGNTIMNITNFFRGNNYDYTQNDFYYDIIKDIYNIRQDIFITWIKKTLKLFLCITAAIGIIMAATIPELTFASGIKIMIVIFAISKVASLPLILKEYPILKDLKNIIMSTPVTIPEKNKVIVKEKIDEEKKVETRENKKIKEIKNQHDILNDLLGIWLMLPKDSDDYWLIKNNIDFLQMLRNQIKNHEPVNMQQYDLIWSNLTALHQKYMKPLERKRNVLVRTKEKLKN